MVANLCIVCQHDVAVDIQAPSRCRRCKICEDRRNNGAENQPACSLSSRHHCQMMMYSSSCQYRKNLYVDENVSVNIL